MRHFPRLAEQTEGMARGAGLSLDGLVEALGREAREGSQRRARLGAEVRPRGERSCALIRAVFPESSPKRVASFVLRRSRPESGYSTLAVVRPWLAAALAGVNESGLAGACALGEPPDTCGGCQAPAFLLLDECLARFDAVEKALEWCERRPAGGAARIVLAAADGAVGAIEIRGADRRRVSVSDSNASRELGSPDPPRDACRPDFLRLELEPEARRVVLSAGRDSPCVGVL